MFKSDKQPYCRCCGKPIPKATTLVWTTEKRTSYERDHPGMRYVEVGNRPLRTKADAQKLTNAIVTSVSYREKSGPDFEPIPDSRYIWKFTEWDGESYRHKHFCNLTRCAVDFALVIAELNPKVHIKSPQGR